MTRHLSRFHNATILICATLALRAQVSFGTPELIDIDWKFSLTADSTAISTDYDDSDMSHPKASSRRVSGGKLLIYLRRTSPTPATLTLTSPLLDFAEITIPVK